MVRPTVNSTKHYVQTSLATVTAAAVLDIGIATAVNAPSANLAGEVREGCVIKAVFIEMWVRTNDTSAGTALVTLYKRSGGDTSITAAEQAALFTYDNKKNVLYHTQGLTNVNTDSATPFIRQWFKIPKGKQRFGLNDKLSLSIFAQALDQNVCGFMVYKEYF